MVVYCAHDIGSESGLELIVLSESHVVTFTTAVTFCRLDYRQLVTG